MVKIAGIVLLSAAGLFGLFGYSPRAVPLEPGAVYRTGSPLSQPGIIGLFGGLLGTRRGGGYEQWNGPYIGTNDTVYDKRDSGYWTPATQAQFQAQQGGLLLSRAAQLNAVAPRDGQNAPRAIVPQCDGQLFVTYVRDTALGARTTYSCGGN